MQRLWQMPKKLMIPFGHTMLIKFQCKISTALPLNQQGYDLTMGTENIDHYDPLFYQVSYPFRSK